MPTICKRESSAQPSSHKDRSKVKRVKADANLDSKQFPHYLASGRQASGISRVSGGDTGGFTLDLNGVHQVLCRTSLLPFKLNFKDVTSAHLRILWGSLPLCRKLWNSHEKILTMDSKLIRENLNSFASTRGNLNTRKNCSEHQKLINSNFLEWQSTISWIGNHTS